VEVRRLSLAAVGEAIKAVTKTEKAKGGEVKGTLRSTPLGRTVIEWLLTKFGDILEYGFTAAMERQLDEVAEGSREWASVLQDTWSSYKDRYLEVTRAPNGSKGGLGEGYKFLVSKKGPLFVYEKEGEKTRFATVPKNLSRETATLEHAKAAFAQVSGETTLGDLDGEPVMKKSGKFGPYVTWKSITLSLKGAETFEEICAGLQGKVGSIDHQVGPFRIKKGPYGLYMYKTESGTKKPTFVGIPANTEWSKLTVEGAEALYRASKKA
jgi:DNA topoisomerase-1